MVLYTSVLCSGKSITYYGKLIIENWYMLPCTAMRKTHKNTPSTMYSQFPYRFIKNETSNRPLCSLRLVAYGPVKSLSV